MAFAWAEARAAARLMDVPDGAKPAANTTAGSKIWCGREDSNFHGLSPTATSTLRVYHFRHDRIAVGGR